MSRRAALLILAAVLGLVLAPLTGAYAQGQSVHGTLRAPDGRPVAGVIITASRDGAESGKATTAKDGTWDISLPAGGRYTISLDVGTLPPGLGPAREGGPELGHPSAQVTCRG